MGPPPAPAGLPLREYLLVGLTAAVLTFLLTGLVRLLAIRSGAVAMPRDRDVHLTPIPRLGGLAMYGGILGGVLLAHQLPVLRRSFEFSFDVVAVLVAGGITYDTTVLIASERGDRQMWSRHGRMGTAS